MPKYDLDKIKFGTDEGTFQKAVDLYESGKIKDFHEGIKSYTSTVIGTNPYKVFVEDRRFDYGHCTCYLGQNDTLCKHQVAVAIYAVKQGKPLTGQEKKYAVTPTWGGKLGKLSVDELTEKKREITHALRYIKTYDGPSRTWFAYQDSLSEGCRRLSAIVSLLSASEQTADLLVKLLLRLDKKLCNSGIDDSNGTVGGFMEAVVLILQEYAKRDRGCILAFSVLVGAQTCFGWEEPLVKMIKKNGRARNNDKNGC